MTTTTPDVPLRLEFSVEVPGTPEQVWAAIATADGLSAWSIPTDIDEREGGVVRFHMGDDISSDGTVTGWDPPRRLVYEEPDWAALVGREGEAVTPIVSEFLVEARSGGTCVVKVVSSAFGTGAEWEQEFFTDMEGNWRPLFDTLGLYLAHFPGQRASSLSCTAEVPGDAVAVWAEVLRALGVDEVGQAVEARGVRGRVEQLDERRLVLRLEDPAPGFLTFFAFQATVGLEGQLFGDDAPDYVERERPGWKAWLEGLAVPSA